MPGKIGRGETVEVSKTGLTGPSRILFPSAFSQIGPFIFLLSWKPGSSQRSQLPRGSFLWYYFCPTALTPKDVENAGGGCPPWVLMPPSDHCSSTFPKLSQPWISGCFIIPPSLRVITAPTCCLPDHAPSFPDVTGLMSLSWLNVTLPKLFNSISISM